MRLSFITILALTMAAAFVFQIEVTRAETCSSTPMKAQMDEKAPQWLEDYDVPSVAVALIECGKPAWTAVYGEQSPGVMATKDTLYNVASMAKPISAEVILRLAAKGELSLGEPLSGYWVDPDIKDNPWHELLTPRISLSHQTGFTNWRYQTNDVLTFQWEPGTQTGYSGEGFEYVAQFAENKMGQSFEDLAQRYVFDPIGMQNTAFTKRDWFEGRVAVPQGPEGETGTPQLREHSKWVASDDLHTTIDDYARFLISVMNEEGLTEEIATERRTIHQDLKEKQCRPDKVKSEACPVNVGYGRSWFILEYENETIVMHDGGDWGENTIGFYVPERQMGLVIFTNGANGDEVIRDAVALLFPNPEFIEFLWPARRYPR